jgi:hypothetical protein
MPGFLSTFVLCTLFLFSERSDTPSSVRVPAYMHMQISFSVEIYGCLADGTRLGCKEVASFGFGAFVLEWDGISWTG